jgi:hypothetical protein
MKAIVWKLVCVGCLMLASGASANGSEEYRDDRDIIRFFGNFHPNYAGTVTAVEQHPGRAAQVRIRATVEDPEHARHEVSKECVLQWTQTEQPVPFAPGMSFTFTAKNDGQVTAVVYDAALPFYRKRADSSIEVVLHVRVGTDTERVWIRVLPDRINLMPAVNVGWSRQHGLVISMFEADAGDAEQESLRSRDQGLPMANVPGERIQIGRDGWKTAPDLHHGQSKGVVPPKQYIGAAG